MADVIMTQLRNNYDSLRDKWKWAVRCFCADGAEYGVTVHKTDWSRDLEIEICQDIPEISKIIVQTWHEAGKPIVKTAQERR